MLFASTWLIRCPAMDEPDRVPLSFKGKPAFQQEVALERVIYDTSCLESASGGSLKRRGMKAVEGVSAFHAEVPLLGIGASGAGKQTK